MNYVMFECLKILGCDDVVVFHKRLASEADLFDAEDVEDGDEVEAELVQAGEGGELLRPRLLARQRHVDVDSALPNILQPSRGALKVQGINVNPPCMLAWLVKSIHDS